MPASTTAGPVRRRPRCSTSQDGVSATILRGPRPRAAHRRAGARRRLPHPWRLERPSGGRRIWRARTPPAVRGVAAGDAAAASASAAAACANRSAYQLLERAQPARRGAAARDVGAGSRRAARDLQLGVPIAVVPNGVDLESAQSVPRGYRERLGIPQDAFVVLYLGRMHRIKRLDLLADAFDDLRADPFVGASGARRTRRAGIGSRADAPLVRARIIGTPDRAVGGRDKWALLRDADATVVCSDSESFGMTVVESLAAGVPAVVTHTCPWSEIEQRQCGLWVEQRAAAIANALRQLADDPVARRQMGVRAAAFARERYGWDAIAPVMSRLYAGLL